MKKLISTLSVVVGLSVVSMGYCNAYKIHQITNNTDHDLCYKVTTPNNLPIMKITNEKGNSGCKNGTLVLKSAKNQSVNMQVVNTYLYSDSGKTLREDRYTIGKSSHSCGNDEYLFQNDMNFPSPYCKSSLNLNLTIGIAQTMDFSAVS